ncbi:MAG: type II toxin-antitoxin system PemK/MazF family toxin [Chloroflexaceae bacterium]|nr:type II toxin-antitoxin system PemK/MazF family toxin [Chloroflexaceae bacterium]
MKRGEVWWVNFDPSVGGEIKKERPAVIVSESLINKILNRVQVVPLTSKMGTLYPNQAYVVFNGVQHKAMADQLTTVSKLRLIRFAGSISKSDLKQVEQAIKFQLDLE